MACLLGGAQQLDGRKEVAGHILETDGCVAGRLVGEDDPILDGVIARDHAGGRGVDPVQDVLHGVGVGVVGDLDAVDLEGSLPVNVSRDGRGEVSPVRSGIVERTGELEDVHAGPGPEVADAGGRLQACDG
ncbi:hypothetical protein D3C86_1068780 [compost metagenome]